MGDDDYTDWQDEPVQVVINHEEQFSIWPADREPPDGWAALGISGEKDACLAYVEACWTDMRPLSLRVDMDGDAVISVWRVIQEQRHERGLPPLAKPDFLLAKLEEELAQERSSIEPREAQIERRIDDNFRDLIATRAAELRRCKIDGDAVRQDRLRQALDEWSGERDALQEAGLLDNFLYWRAAEAACLEADLTTLAKDPEYIRQHTDEALLCDVRIWQEEDDTADAYRCRPGLRLTAAQREEIASDHRPEVVTA